MRIKSKFYDLFQNKYTNDRWHAFSLIYEHLRSLGSPVVIVETGIARKDDDWSDDGNSTAVWNYIAVETGGKYLGIDIDADAIARCQKTFPSAVFVCADSIVALRQLAHANSVNLLYLDSYDLDVNNPLPAATHNAAELLSVYSQLPSGCLIAIDDCNISTTDNSVANSGKNLISRNVLHQLGATLLFDSYINVWQKK